MIQATNLMKTYGTSVVLKDVSLTINKGDRVAILGKSGAGKSTLLHILGTIDKADGGKLWMNGVNVFTLKDKELAHFRNTYLGFIFQFHYLLPEFSALENVCIPAWIQKAKNATAIEQQAKDLLHSLDILHRSDAKPSQLSGGEQQRVCIARALINNPLFVLADEPTGNLDTESSEKFMELILQLKQKNNFTFVMVTHNQSIVENFDRKIVIQDGSIVAACSA